MSVFRDKLIAAGLKMPKMVTLSMTNACNLRCSHCWPDSGPLKRFSPVPTRTLERLISEIACLGAEEICLAGGEPLIHPDWYAVLSHACRQTEIKQVTLQTNATLIDEAFAKENVPHKLIVFPDAGHGLEGAETRATVVREAVGWFDQHLQALAPQP